MGIVINQSIRNTLFFYIGMLIGAANTVIIYPIVFKENPEYLGLLQVLVAYALVAATFSALGVPRMFIRYFPKVQDKGQLYFLSLVVPLLGFLLLYLFYAIFQTNILDWLHADQLLQDNFYYIFLLLIFIGYFDILSSVSRSHLSSSVPIFINEVFLRLYTMVILLLYWQGYFDFSILLFVYVLGYFLKFFLLFLVHLLQNRLFFTFSFANLNLKEMLKYSSFVMVGSASLMLVTKIDMMMIGTLLGLEQVAYYTIAFFIGNVIQIPGRSVASITDPLVAKAWEEHDIEKIRILYVKSSINQLIIGGIFFLCIWLSIDDVFALLPEKFQGGKWVVFFIGVAQLFNITSGINGTIIVNSNFYRYDLYTNLFLVFLTIFTNWIFIPLFGISGAALASAISVFLFNIVRLLLIRYKMSMQPFSAKTFITVLILFGLYFLMQIIPISLSSFWNIVVRSLIVLGIAVPLVLLLKLSEDINTIFSELRKKYLG